MGADCGVVYEGWASWEQRLSRSGDVEEKVATRLEAYFELIMDTEATNIRDNRRGKTYGEEYGEKVKNLQLRFRCSKAAEGFKASGVWPPTYSNGDRGLQ